MRLELIISSRFGDKAAARIQYPALREQSRDSIEAQRPRAPVDVIAVYLLQRVGKQEAARPPPLPYPTPPEEHDARARAREQQQDTNAHKAKSQNAKLDRATTYK